jgi:hypothetical protein
MAFRHPSDVYTRQNRASTAPGPMPPSFPRDAAIPPSLIPGFRHRQTISVANGADNLLFPQPDRGKRTETGRVSATVTAVGGMIPGYYYVSPSPCHGLTPPQPPPIPPQQQQAALPPLPPKAAIIPPSMSPILPPKPPPFMPSPPSITPPCRGPSPNHPLRYLEVHHHLSIHHPRGRHQYAAAETTWGALHFSHRDTLLFAIPECDASREGFARHQ